MSKAITVIVLSHLLNKSIERFFSALISSCGKEFEVRFLADNTGLKFNNSINDRYISLFTKKNLENLGYPGKNSISYEGRPEQSGRYHKGRNWSMGNTELPVLYFFRDNPNFDYYWIIEYDVRYSGNWQHFFKHFEDCKADLLATSLVTQMDTPDWPRWQSLHLPGNEQSVENNCLRGFFPIYRISNRALRQLDIEYLKGASGHYECLMPTVLGRAGLTLEDIGGNGRFTKSENLNRFYTNTPSTASLAPGTFVFRPVRNKVGKQPNMLWHPVKHRPFWRVWLSQINHFFFS